jgi:hypothetical protein
VLFGTSSFSARNDARWLGGCVTNSAFLLGRAVPLALAILTGQERATAPVRLSLVPLLMLNRAALSAVGHILAGAWSSAP